MPEPTSDPRVYFAAERTMLAWLRTGIAIMAFGFVVARFGLFLRLLQAQGTATASEGLSSYLGAAIVGLGVLATASGALQYGRFCRSRALAERPATARPGFLLGLSWVLAILGVVLGFVLLV